MTQTLVNQKPCSVECDESHHTCTVFHLNVRSLKRNHHNLEALILSLESPPAVLCLSETWLTDSDDLNSSLVNGYNQHLSRNRTTRGGGVMNQVRSDYTLVKELKLNLEAAVQAIIEKQGYAFNVLVLYNKHRTNKLEFVESFDRLLENSTEENVPLVICGDFNINVMEKNLVTRNFLNCICANGFEISDGTPTRVTTSFSTSKDHFVYQNIVDANVDVLQHQSFSDHSPITI